MTFTFSPGAWLAPVVDWLNTNLHGLFAAISMVIEAVLGGIQAALLFPPAWAVILIVAALAWALLGWGMGLLAAIALGFCFVMDLWKESMETIALVTVSVAISVAIAVPLGILAAAGRASRRRCARCSTSCRRCRLGST